MNDMDKAFLFVYEPIMLGKGFKRKGIIFHRLLNRKIIQMLSLFKYSIGFTIQFNIQPLCAGYMQTKIMDNTRLGSLLGKGSCAEWDFCESDLVDQVRESLVICEEYLFPCFEQVFDYYSYYEYAMDTHRRFISHISEAYKEKHRSILNVPNDDAFFATSLHIGNYSDAKTSKEAIIMINDNGYKTNLEAWKKRGINPPPEILHDIENTRSDYLRVKKAIDSNDRAFIQDVLEYIKAREARSLESYIITFLGKIAFQAYQQNIIDKE